MKTNVLTVQQYSTNNFTTPTNVNNNAATANQNITAAAAAISGKPDIVREVVMKYIDHFYPDTSGTSAVAIDNKIEQAMDLVKSHLMIAVREEVEVLKEKITELMEKINLLEVENTILKKNVPQETLTDLQTMLQQAAAAAAQQQPQQPQSQQTTQPQNVVTANTQQQSVQQQTAVPTTVGGGGAATGPQTNTQPTNGPVA
ncbi:TSC22D4 family protein [Megaselia abdita]